MSRALSDFRRYVLPFCPGLPATMVDQYVLDIFRDVCERADCWRYELAPIDIVADQQDYELDDWPSCAELVRILKVELSGAELDVDQDEYTLATDAEDQDNPKSTVRLADFVIPAADESGGLIVTVALRPKLTATQTCDQLFRDYYRVVRDGVAATVLAQAGKPWSDANSARHYQREYEAGIATVRWEILRGSTSKDLTMHAQHSFV
jgi:hypothetical protein